MFLDWNAIMEWVKQNDAPIYNKMSYSLSEREKDELDALNRKKTNDRPKNVNPIYVAKVLC